MLVTSGKFPRTFNAFYSVLILTFNLRSKCNNWFVRHPVINQWLLGRKKAPIPCGGSNAFVKLCCMSQVVEWTSRKQKVNQVSLIKSRHWTHNNSWCSSICKPECVWVNEATKKSALVTVKIEKFNINAPFTMFSQYTWPCRLFSHRSASLSNPWKTQCVGIRISADSKWLSVQGGHVSLVTGEGQSNPTSLFRMSDWR